VSVRAVRRVPEVRRGPRRRDPQHARLAGQQRALGGEPGQRVGLAEQRLAFGQVDEHGGGHDVRQQHGLVGKIVHDHGRPAAFGERDLRTLEVLADRILKNAEARQASLISIGLAPPALEAAPAMQENATEASAEEHAEKLANRFQVELGAGLATEVEVGDLPTTGAEPMEENAEALPAWRFDWFTTVTGAVILAVALLMGTVLAMRLGWLKGSSHRQAAPAGALSSSSSSSFSGGPAISASRGAKAIPAGAIEPPAASGAGNRSSSGQGADGTEKVRVPEGSLRVYANGKEIFRMPPAIAEAAAGAPTATSANTALPPEGIAKVPADAAEGSLVRRVEPQYPEQARLQRIQGPVVLHIRIGRTGAVQEVKLVSGDPLLAEAAIAAVRQWRFKPHTVNGRAVDVETEIILKFTLPLN